MWGDESATYQLAHRDLTQIWRTAQHVDLVHAFYYVIMHEIYGLVGGGLLTLRLPSVLAMSAAAAGVGLLGLRPTGLRAGLLAGLVYPLFRRFSGTHKKPVPTPWCAPSSPGRPMCSSPAS
ncbi:mannosyltransferase [Streptomyces mirabilis]|jgi:mannosyltransferase|uniref:Mannosyltransferase n=1 Tax=Streptomyces mirabilis TaxID=68239 RepID=A0A1I2TZW4_9ACTN|nr:mannosyltransferase [Streptomyces mirabilis]